MQAPGLVSALENVHAPAPAPALDEIAAQPAPAPVPAPTEIVAPSAGYALVDASTFEFE